MQITTTLNNQQVYNRFKFNSEKSFDIQGHKGCRGLMPENTIQAFIEALKVGASTLFIDVVVSGDGQLVASNDPWISSETCLAPDGSFMGKEEHYNMFEMTYEEIRQYDCGRKINPAFPMQKSVSSFKPLLAEVIRRIEKYILWNSFRQVQYNFSIKSAPEWDNIYQPKPEEIVLKLYDLMRMQNIQRRCIIQSLDVRPLQMFRRLAPTQRTSLLVENNFSMEENIEALGFLPSIYSPCYKLVDNTLIKSVHQKEMLLIPWTVNDILDMNELRQMGVDGLITDYPDIAVKLLE